MIIRDHLLPLFALEPGTAAGVCMGRIWGGRGRDNWALLHVRSGRRHVVVIRRTNTGRSRFIYPDRRAYPWSQGLPYKERRSIMLVLTRRLGETLKIGDTIEVTVLGIKGNQVRIGMAAPRDVPVHREEIYEKVRAESAVAGGHC